MDCSSPGFSVHRILQARIQDWVAISFSNQRKSLCEYQKGVDEDNVSKPIYVRRIVGLEVIITNGAMRTPSAKLSWWESGRGMFVLFL